MKFNWIFSQVQGSSLDLLLRSTSFMRILPWKGEVHITQVKARKKGNGNNYLRNLTHHYTRAGCGQSLPTSWVPAGRKGAWRDRTRAQLLMPGPPALHPWLRRIRSGILKTPCRRRGGDRSWRSREAGWREWRRWPTFRSFFSGPSRSWVVSRLFRDQDRCESCLSSA